MFFKMIDYKQKSMAEWAGHAMGLQFKAFERMSQLAMNAPMQQVGMARAFLGLTPPKMVEAASNTAGTVTAPTTTKKAASPRQVKRQPAASAPRKTATAKPVAKITEPTAAPAKPRSATRKKPAVKPPVAPKTAAKPVVKPAAAKSAPRTAKSTTAKPAAPQPAVSEAEAASPATSVSTRRRREPSAPPSLPEKTIATAQPPVNVGKVEKTVTAPVKPEETQS